ncbi:MAG: HEPN domain-containing protein [Candidatus Altiarchaeota archaeon]|nr:HEPN domain-containing protein [Candidatus Altiarchaeota archaeon]
MKQSKSEIAKSYFEEAKKKFKNAKSLLEDCYYDDAARNAYYSMFHAAKALLALKDVEPKTHHGVISELQRLYVNTKELDQPYASSLARDLQVRIRSDYGVLVDTTKEMAEESVKDAKAFIEAAKRFFL